MKCPCVVHKLSLLKFVHSGYFINTCLLYRSEFNMCVWGVILNAVFNLSLQFVFCYVLLFEKHENYLFALIKKKYTYIFNNTVSCI